MADLISQEFYALIGKGVTQWAQIDRLIFEIFEASLGVEEAKASVCYASQNGMANRLKLVQATLNVDESQEAAEFKKIAAEINAAVGARNMMAHGHPVFSALTRIIFAEGGEVGDPSDWFGIVRPKHERRGPTELRQEEVREHIVTVWKIKQKLEDLLLSLTDGPATEDR